MLSPTLEHTTARMKEDKETEEEYEQKRVKMERSYVTRNTKKKSGRFSYRLDYLHRRSLLPEADNELLNYLTNLTHPLNSGGYVTVRNFK